MQHFPLEPSSWWKIALHTNAHSPARLANLIKSAESKTTAFSIRHFIRRTNRVGCLSVCESHNISVDTETFMVKMLISFVVRKLNKARPVILYKHDCRANGFE